MCDRTITTNGAVALKTSGNKFVDFFMMLVRGIETDLIKQYMLECWKEDPAKTVSIVFHARDRQNGKKEKNISNRCMIWLKNHKYGTYTKNIRKYVTKYGCWKDMIYISIKTHGRNDFEIDSIADQLRKDKLLLEEGKTYEVSLCAKWASSQQDKNDVKFNTAHYIAAKLFPNDPKSMERYRKEYLAPLRKNIDIVESYMASNKWKEIKYEKVPAVATKRLKNAFEKHDPLGYKNYLQQVANGTKKINITGILPHELVKYYLDGNEYNETIEQQWKALLENIKSQGILDNMLAVVDTSGSMSSGGCGNVQPIEPAIALGLLIAECNTGQFHKKIISFHSNPTIFDIKGDSLYEQVKHISRDLPQDANTNFEATFDLILNVASMFNIPPEKMPKKLVVLSDMQFDAAKLATSDISEEILHEYIVKKYNSTAYEPPVFIYWNLSAAHNETFPVKSVAANVAMISGFSEQLLKVFMNCKDFNPENIVNEILSKYIIEVVIDEADR